MTRRFFYLSAIALLLFFAPTVASAVINEWTTDGSGNIIQSSTPCPGGEGVSAISGAVLDSKDLTQAYLIGADLSNTSCNSTILTDAYLSQANLTNAFFDFSILIGANFANANVQLARFAGTTSRGFTQSQLQSTASYKAYNLSGVGLSGNDLTGWDFHNQNLARVQLDYSTIKNAIFTNANIQGTLFCETGLTQTQLQSTASYKVYDLTGVNLGSNDLTGWDFHNQNLTRAGFAYANLTDTEFNNALVQGATFYGATYNGFTQVQLQSTASYKACDLSGVNLGANDLSGWDFHNQKLTNVAFYYSDLTNANLTGADLRGSGGFDAAAAITKNAILPDGTIQGLHLDQESPKLIVRNYEYNLFPIYVSQGMQLENDSVLDIVLNDKKWLSTISFDADIPVTIAGDLQLEFNAADIETLVGTTYKLFDWSGVYPTGQFKIVSDEVWNTSHLYTDGTVTLLAVPEPTVLMQLGCAVMISALALTQRRKRRK